MSHPPSKFLVVGIGASAGGVEALQTFFAHLPVASGCAYVVILHLAPEYESNLAPILQAVTPLPVTVVTERVRVEPDHVYVVPPNQHLAMVDGALLVSPNTEPEDRRAPIDIFFRTLAESHQSRGVCVVLSGSGADGSMGLKRVKERGGAVFVQNPRETAFAEMPRSAIATDLVDEVLPVAEIPARIVAYRASLGAIVIPEEPEQRPREQQEALREIFTLLRAHTGHDFANYKRATLLRRIERRISVRNLPDLEAYAARLRAEPDEVQALLKDLLISVTNFFRDKAAFAALEQEVLPRIFAGKGAGDEVRLWVVGCATGEEAYSVAMLCAERTFELPDAPAVQVFATDIDEAAIARSRAGLYTSADIADVSPERLRRFFTFEDERYRVRPELRELVLFANHNLLTDPPFSHIDLVTCRNVLIYLNRTAQERVIETFHFALDPGGYLFLGNVESADGASNLFAPLSREHRLFQRRSSTSQLLSLPMSGPLPRPAAARPPALPAPAAVAATQPRERINVGDLHLQLLEQYAPPSLLVNQDFEVVHVSERAGRYLLIGGGEPTRSLLELVRPELRVELRSALYQALQRQASVDTPPLPAQIEARTEQVTIRVRPALLPDEPARGLLLVLFEPGATAAAEEALLVRSDEPATRQLEAEVARLKLQLRTTSEQHDSQAEELRATNEEQQALVEELRASSEELHTSKEELQATNEELRTVNQELKVKIEDATRSSANLQNLVNSTAIATIFLDRQLRVRLFTPAARGLFNLIPADYGRPLSDLTHQLADVDVLADAETVFATLQPVEREVHATDGRVFVLRVLPYRTAEDHIGGVVLTFFDITARTRAEEALRRSEEKYRALFETMDDGFAIAEIIVDEAGRPVDYRMIEINPQFERLTGQPRELFLSGRTVREVAPELEEEWYSFYGQVGLTGQPAHREIHAAAWNRWFAVSAYRVGEPDQRRVAILYAEITERKRAEQELRASDERQAFLLMLSDALRPLADPVDIQATVTQTAMQQFNADRCYYCEIEDGQAIIRRDAAQDDLPSVVGVYPLSSMPIFRAVVDAGRPFVVEDAHTSDLLDEPLRQLCVQLGVISFVDVPVIKNGQPVGVLCITQRTRREWTDVEVELAAETAERTWAAVERARAEAAVRGSEEQFRRAIEEAPIPVIMHAEDGEVLQISRSWTELTGYTLADVPTLDAWLNRAYGHGADAVRTHMQELFAGNQRSLNVAFEIRTRAGELRHWSFSASSPGRLRDGRRFVVGMALDISERKRAEQALAEQARLLDLSNDAIIVRDVQNRILFWNHGATELYGWTREEAVGQDLHTLLKTEFEIPFEQLIALLREQDRMEGEVVQVTRDGRRLTLLCRWALDRDAAGQPGAILTTTNDISERKQAEQALQRARDELERRVQERTAALTASNQARQELLRQLVAAQEEERRRIARELHDSLGQYLSALTLELARVQAAPGITADVHSGLARLQRLAREIDAELDSLTMELRPPVLDDLGLEAALRRYVEEWGATSGVAVEMSATGLDTRRLPLAAEATAYRVVQEALTNVRKHAAARRVSLVLQRRDGVLQVIVEDDGVGFEPEVVARERSGGRQLGLVGMGERATLAGGTITIESGLGVGTTIFLRIPVVGEQGGTA